MNMHQSGELETVLESAGVLVPAEEAVESRHTEEGESRHTEGGVESRHTEAGEVIMGLNEVEDVGVVHGEEEGGEKLDVRKDKMDV